MIVTVRENNSSLLTEVNTKGSLSIVIANYTTMNIKIASAYKENKCYFTYFIKLILPEILDPKKRELLK